MAPRVPPQVPQPTIAEMDTEFDELASVLSKDPRDQLTSGIGEITTRLHSRGFRTDNERDQFDSDVAMDENNQINAATHNTEVLVRTVPLQVKKWRDMDKFHPSTTTSVWRKLKVIIAFSGWLLQYIFDVQQKFPELSEEDKDCAMRQVESQYNNRRYRLLQTYRNNKPRPQHVSPEGWQWLIRNLWTYDDFQKRSNQNSINRGKQEMGSKVGTISIAQIAYDLRDPETGEWPTAMQVWRATYQKADGTWSIPMGEEIMTKLHEAAGIHQEKISSAPMPIVEHFALVLGRKPNHSRGVGIRAVNRLAKERIRLQVQIEAFE
ncbi:unnamed protein product [Miscanthus lutarioriparius]|uniref:Transposase n=1 Tax=Miscanthus lutarioriparius TaxID=422564 RepID=A0A811NR87_9POAL|nr:unnamed protein product [Miscanthus lutarioriparius]